jgi:hypothetical protein
MKLQPSKPDPSNPEQRSKRRGVLLGAAALGAGALAARVLPGGAADAVSATPKPETDTAAGYRESEHVLRYYETTRI